MSEALTLWQFSVDGRRSRVYVRSDEGLAAPQHLGGVLERAFPYLVGVENDTVVRLKKLEKTGGMRLTFFEGRKAHQILIDGDKVQATRSKKEGLEMPAEEVVKGVRRLSVKAFSEMHKRSVVKSHKAEYKMSTSEVKRVVDAFPGESVSHSKSTTLTAEKLEALLGYVAAGLEREEPVLDEKAPLTSLQKVSAMVREGVEISRKWQEAKRNMASQRSEQDFKLFRESQPEEEADKGKEKKVKKRELSLVDRVNDLWGGGEPLMVPLFTGHGRDRVAQILLFSKETAAGQPVVMIKKICFSDPEKHSKDVSAVEVFYSSPEQLKAPFFQGLLSLSTVEETDFDLERPSSANSDQTLSRFIAEYSTGRPNERGGVERVFEKLEKKSAGRDPVRLIYEVLSQSTKVETRTRLFTILKSKLAFYRWFVEQMRDTYFFKKESMSAQEKRKFLLSMQHYIARMKRGIMSLGAREVSESIALNLEKEVQEELEKLGKVGSMPKDLYKGLEAGALHVSADVLEGANVSADKKEKEEEMVANLGRVQALTPLHVAHVDATGEIFGKGAMPGVARLHLQRIVEMGKELYTQGRTSEARELFFQALKKLPIPEGGGFWERVAQAGDPQLTEWIELIGAFQDEIFVANGRDKKYCLGPREAFEFETVLPVLTRYLFKFQLEHQCGKPGTYSKKLHEHTRFLKEYASVDVEGLKKECTQEVEKARKAFSDRAPEALKQLNGEREELLALLQNKEVIEALKALDLDSADVGAFLKKVDSVELPVEQREALLAFVMRLDTHLKEQKALEKVQEEWVAVAGTAPFKASLLKPVVQALSGILGLDFLREKMERLEKVLRLSENLPKLLEEAKNKRREEIRIAVKNRWKNINTKVREYYADQLRERYYRVYGREASIAVANKVHQQLATFDGMFDLYLERTPRDINEERRLLECFLGPEVSLFYRFGDLYVGSPSHHQLHERFRFLYGYTGSDEEVWAKKADLVDVDHMLLAFCRDRLFGRSKEEKRRVLNEFFGLNKPDNGLRKMYSGDLSALIQYSDYLNEHLEKKIAEGIEEEYKEDALAQFIIGFESETREGADCAAPNMALFREGLARLDFEKDNLGIPYAARQQVRNEQKVWIGNQEFFSSGTTAGSNKELSFVKDLEDEEERVRHKTAFILKARGDEFVLEFPKDYDGVTANVTIKLSSDQNQKIDLGSLDHELKASLNKFGIHSLETLAQGNEVVGVRIGIESGESTDLYFEREATLDPLEYEKEPKNLTEDETVKAALNQISPRSDWIGSQYYPSRNKMWALVGKIAELAVPIEQIRLGLVEVEGGPKSYVHATFEEKERCDAFLVRDPTQLASCDPEWVQRYEKTKSAVLTFVDPEKFERGLRNSILKSEVWEELNGPQYFTDAFYEKAGPVWRIRDYSSLWGRDRAVLTERSKILEREFAGAIYEPENSFFHSTLGYIAKGAAYSRLLEGKKYFQHHQAFVLERTKSLPRAMSLGYFSDLERPLWNEKRFLDFGHNLTVSIKGFDKEEHADISNWSSTRSEWMGLFPFAGLEDLVGSMGNKKKHASDFAEDEAKLVAEAERGEDKRKTNWLEQYLNPGEMLLVYEMNILGEEFPSLQTLNPNSTQAVVAAIETLHHLPEQIGQSIYLRQFIYNRLFQADNLKKVIKSNPEILIQCGLRLRETLEQLASPHSVKEGKEGGDAGRAEGVKKVYRADEEHESLFSLYLLEISERIRALAQQVTEEKSEDVDLERVREIGKALPEYNKNKFVNAFNEYKSSKEQKKFALYLLNYFSRNIPQGNSPQALGDWATLYEAYFYLVRTPGVDAHPGWAKEMRARFYSQLLPRLKKEILVDGDLLPTFLANLVKDADPSWEWMVSAENPYVFTCKRDGKVHVVDLTTTRGVNGFNMNPPKRIQFPRHLKERLEDQGIDPGEEIGYVNMKMEETGEDSLKVTYSWKSPHSDGTKFLLVTDYNNNRQDFGPFKLYQEHPEKGRFLFQKMKFGESTLKKFMRIFSKSANLVLFEEIKERGVWVKLHGDSSKVDLSNVYYIPEKHQGIATAPTIYRMEVRSPYPGKADMVNISIGEGEKRRYLCEGLTDGALDFLPFRNGVGLKYFTYARETFSEPKVDEVELPAEKGREPIAFVRRGKEWYLRSVEGGASPWKWEKEEDHELTEAFGEYWKFMCVLRNEKTGQKQWVFFPYLFSGKKGELKIHRSVADVIDDLHLERLVTKLRSVLGEQVPEGALPAVGLLETICDEEEFAEWAKLTSSSKLTTELMHRLLTSTGAASFNQSVDDFKGLLTSIFSPASLRLTQERGGMKGSHASFFYLAALSAANQNYAQANKYLELATSSMASTERGTEDFAQLQRVISFVTSSYLLKGKGLQSSREVAFFLKFLASTQKLSLCSELGEGLLDFTINLQKAPEEGKEEESVGVVFGELVKFLSMFLFAAHCRHMADPQKRQKLMNYDLILTDEQKKALGISSFSSVLFNIKDVCFKALAKDLDLGEGAGEKLMKILMEALGIEDPKEVLPPMSYDLVSEEDIERLVTALPRFKLDSPCKDVATLHAKKGEALTWETTLGHFWLYWDWILKSPARFETFSFLFAEISPSVSIEQKALIDIARRLLIMHAIGSGKIDRVPDSPLLQPRLDALRAVRKAEFHLPGKGDGLLAKEYAAARFFADPNDGWKLFNYFEQFGHHLYRGITSEAILPKEVKNAYEAIASVLLGLGGKKPHVYGRAEHRGSPYGAQDGYNMRALHLLKEMRHFFLKKREEDLDPKGKYIKCLEKLIELGKLSREEQMKPHKAAARLAVMAALAQQFKDVEKAKQYFVDYQENFVPDLVFEIGVQQGAPKASSEFLDKMFPQPGVIGRVWKRTGEATFAAYFDDEKVFEVDLKELKLPVLETPKLTLRGVESPKTLGKEKTIVEHREDLLEEKKNALSAKLIFGKGEQFKGGLLGDLFGSFKMVLDLLPQSLLSSLYPDGTGATPARLIERFFDNIKNGIQGDTRIEKFLGSIVRGLAESEEPELLYKEVEELLAGVGPFEDLSNLIHFLFSEVDWLTGQDKKKIILHLRRMIDGPSAKDQLTHFRHLFSGFTHLALARSIGQDHPLFHVAKGFIEQMIQGLDARNIESVPAQVLEALRQMDAHLEGMGLSQEMTVGLKSMMKAFEGLTSILSMGLASRQTKKLAHAVVDVFETGKTIHTGHLVKIFTEDSLKRCKRLFQKEFGLAEKTAKAKKVERSLRPVAVIQPLEVGGKDYSRFWSGPDRYFVRNIDVVGDDERKGIWRKSAEEILAAMVPPDENEYPLEATHFKRHNEGLEAALQAVEERTSHVLDVRFYEDVCVRIKERKAALQKEVVESRKKLLDLAYQYRIPLGLRDFFSAKKSGGITEDTQEEVIQLIISRFKMGTLDCFGDHLHGGAVHDYDMAPAVVQFLLASVELEQMGNADMTAKKMRPLFEKEKEVMGHNGWQLLSAQLRGFLDTAADRNRYAVYDENEKVWMLRDTIDRVVGGETQRVALSTSAATRRFLCADYEKGWTSRKLAMEAVEEILHPDPERRKDFLRVKMGVGKTSAIIPTVAEELLLNGYRPICVTTTQLVQQLALGMENAELFEVPLSCLDAAARKKYKLDEEVVIQNDADEAKVKEERSHKKLHGQIDFVERTIQQLKDYQKQGKFIVTSPNTLTNIRNKRILLTIDLNHLLNQEGDEFAQLVGETMELLNKVKQLEALFHGEDVFYIYDEDEPRAVYMDYNVAINRKEKLEPARVGSAEKVMLALIDEEAKGGENFARLRAAFLNNNLRSITDFKPAARELFDMILQDKEYWKDKGCSEENYAQIFGDSKAREALAHYLITGKEKPAFIDRLFDVEEIPDYVKHLGAMRSIAEVLEIIFRVNPNLDRGMSPDDGCTAVPYRDGEPKKNKRYGNIYEEIMHSLVYYTSGCPRPRENKDTGMDEKLFERVFTQMRRSPHPMSREHKLRLAEGEEESYYVTGEKWVDSIKEKCTTINKAFGLKEENMLTPFEVFSGRGSEDIELTEEQYETLRKVCMKERALYYQVLSQEVLGCFPDQVSCNSQDPLIQGERALVLSGTGNDFTLGVSQPGHESVPDKISAETNIVLGFDKPVTVVSDPDQELRQLVADPECKAVLNNDLSFVMGTLAEKQVKSLRAIAPHRDYVYRDDANNKKMWLAGAPKPIDYDPAKVNSDRAFYVYAPKDQRGVDFKIPTGAGYYGMVFVGLGIDKETFDQLCWRMRQLGWGQEGRLAIDEKMARRVVETQGLTDASEIRVKHLVRFIEETTVRKQKVHHQKSVVKRFENLLLAPLDGVLATPEDVAFIADKDKKNVFDKIIGKFVRQPNRREKKVQREFLPVAHLEALLGNVFETLHVKREHVNWREELGVTTTLTGLEYCQERAAKELLKMVRFKEGLKKELMEWINNEERFPFEIHSDRQDLREELKRNLVQMVLDVCETGHMGLAAVGTRDPEKMLRRKAGELKNTPILSGTEHDGNGNSYRLLGKSLEIFADKMVRLKKAFAKARQDLYQQLAAVSEDQKEFDQLLLKYKLAEPDQPLVFASEDPTVKAFFASHTPCQVEATDVTKGREIQVQHQVEQEQEQEQEQEAQREIMQEVMRAVHITGIDITPSFDLENFLDGCTHNNHAYARTYGLMTEGPKNRYSQIPGNTIFISTRAQNLAYTYEGHNPVYRILTYKDKRGSLFFVVTTPTEYEETIEKDFMRLKESHAISVCSLNSPLDPNRLLVEMQGKEGLSYADQLSEEFTLAMIRIKLSLSWWRFSDLEWEALRAWVQSMNMDDFLSLHSALSNIGKDMLYALRHLSDGSERVSVILHAWEASQYTPLYVPLRNAKEHGVKEIGRKVAAIQNLLRGLDWKGTPLDETKTLHSALDYFFSGHVETFVGSTMRYFLGVLNEVNKKSEEAEKLADKEWDYYAPILRHAALEMTAVIMRQHYGKQVHEEIYAAIERRCQLHKERIRALPDFDPTGFPKLDALIEKVQKELKCETAATA
jgi:hypothetical protein